MFNSIFLEVLIGMVFIFLLYSLLATAVQEIIASWMNLRGKKLFNALKLMLHDIHLGDKFVNEFYDHPVIKKIRFSGKDKFPSYIKPETFSLVLKDLIPDVYLGDDKELTMAERIRLLPEGEFKTVIQTYLKNQTSSIDMILETWFNAGMERLSGVYKRNIQNRLLVIGLVIAIAFNVNSIYVFTRLSTDKKARQALVEQAEKFVATNEKYEDLYQRITARDSIQKAADTTGRADTLKISIDTLRDAREDSLLAQFNRQRERIKELIDTEIATANNALGIGWGRVNMNDELNKIKNFQLGDLLKALAGWLLTAIAITIGAPFWFDLLQKLVKLRGTGPKPLTETEKEKIVLKNK